MLPLLLVSMFVALINHHHQHLNTFRSPVLNWIYDLLSRRQTGIGPYAWVPTTTATSTTCPALARARRIEVTRRDGSQMGRIEYTIDLVLNQIDIVRLGLRHRRYLRPFLWMKVPLWSINALAFWYNPRRLLS
ncbi:MAG: hypothetical protein R3F21_21640 [Myxococcota bacterium]